MRWTIVLRLFPAAVVAGGFFLTLRLSSERAEVYQAEREAALDAAYLSFAERTEVEVQRILDEAERVDGLIQALLLSNTESVQATIEALDGFDRGPSLRAVDLAEAERYELILPGGLLPARPLPVVTSGATPVLDGQWSGLVAYRVFDKNQAARSVTVILDLNALEAASQSDLVVEIQGIREPLPLTSVAGDLNPHDHQVHSSPSDGSFLSVRDIELFGRQARIVVRSEPDVIVRYETWGPDQMGLLTMTGGLLTIFGATMAYQLSRRFDRRTTAKEQEGRAKRRAVSRFNASFTHAPVGVVELDAGGLVAMANPRFSELLGYLNEELADKPFLELIDPGERRVVGERIEQLLSGHADADQSERCYRHRNGSAVWVRESLSVLSGEAGSSRVLVQVEDISEERRARAELQRKALFDELTGLPNRANLIQRLRRAVELSQESGQEFAVMFVDLNKFKQVNDSYGHETGDLLLKEVAERLRATSRGSDTVARLGGDEFVILCQQISRVGGAEAAARRYSEALNGSTTIDGVRHEIRASIGLLQAEEGTPEELLRRADEAMYQAKSEGESAFVRYNSSAQRLKINRNGQEAALRRAVDEGELVVHYQPVVRTEGGTRSVIGVEALVRWNHPTDGLIRPADFLPLADKHGLLGVIDEWCIETGSNQLVAWSALTSADPEFVPGTGLGAELDLDSQSGLGSDLNPASWFLSVNTSPELYQDWGFAQRVVAILESTGLDPSRLILERKETTVYNDREAARQSVAELRQSGVRIVLDQFGREFSRMADLMSQEFDGIKLDGSFLRPSDGSDLEAAGEGLAAIVGITRELDLDLVLGGVETVEEAQVAYSAGVSVLQGFHLGRPVAAAELSEQIRNPGTSLGHQSV